MTYLVPFHQVEPDLAAKETRTTTLFEPRKGIPTGSYGLIESYCPDPDCDCRRVMINVVEEAHPTRYLAAIGYGFDRDTADAGPYLDPLNEQCPYADALLRLVQEVALDDPSYVARLERHYERVKAAAIDPAHPAYSRLREAAEDDGGWLSAREMDEWLERPAAGPAPRSVGRNDPCPCGSGKKVQALLRAQEIGFPGKGWAAGPRHLVARSSVDTRQAAYANNARFPSRTCTLSASQSSPSAQG